MRQQLIEALMYPRLLLKQVIEDHNYHHKNMFEATGERCNHCTGEGCGWETCMQDFKKIDDMTTETLSVSLREGINFVEAGLGLLFDIFVEVVGDLAGEIDDAVMFNCLAHPRSWIVAGDCHFGLLISVINCWFSG